MTARPAMPPDFLDCEPGLGDGDSLEDTLPTPWDVLARWHREDGLVVDGIQPTVAGITRGGAAPDDDDIRARRETRDERHRRRGWTLSLRDGGPPPGVRATVCTLAWTTARWHRFAPSRVAQGVVARRAGTELCARAEASAARSACDVWTPWETTHAIAVAALTEAFERRVLSLSNPSDRIRKRAATKAAAAAGDALAVAAARVSLASLSLPSDSTNRTRRRTRWDALTVANVALRAIERTRAKARVIARLASQPPTRARGDPRDAEARRTRSRIARDAGKALDEGLGRLVATSGLGGARYSGVYDHGDGSRAQTSMSMSLLFAKTPAMGARAAVAEMLARAEHLAGNAASRGNRRDARAVAEKKTRREKTKTETDTETDAFVKDDGSKVRAKVLASPTHRRVLGDASNRRSMFSPVSPGAGSPAPARSRLAGARR